MPFTDISAHPKVINLACFDEYPALVFVIGSTLPAKMRDW
jgi:hypothetical protein